MKKLLLTMLALVCLCGVSYAAQAYTQYEVFDSTGLHVITWDKKTTEVYVVRGTTHTVNINLAGSLADASTNYIKIDSAMDSKANFAIKVKRSAGTNSAIFISNDGVGTPDIRVIGYGDTSLW